MYLTNYVKIKDNYCLCYFGNNKEHVMWLKYVRPMLEKTHPDINIYLATNERLFSLLEGENRVLRRQDLTRKEKLNFAHIRELKQDVNSDVNVVEEFIKECGLNFPP
jgi:hypothetical protein